MGREKPLKIAQFSRETGPPSNSWFSGPNRGHISNGILIGSAVLAQLTIVTNRQKHRLTHRPRNIGNNRLHLMLAMRPNNNMTNKL